MGVEQKTKKNKKNTFFFKYIQALISVQIVRLLTTTNQPMKSRLRGSSCGEIQDLIVWSSRFDSIQNQGVIRVKKEQLTESTKFISN